MEKKKLVNFIMCFILIQPIYDVFIYFLNEFNINFPMISVIRPLVMIALYVYLLFDFEIKTKDKVISFGYLAVYGIFSLIHLWNIKNNFFSLSYGSLGGEFRYLCDYGYYLLVLVNFSFIFKITNKEEKRKILISLIGATLIIALLHILAVISGTSPVTYIYSPSKNGWKGWSVSSHYVGHSILYMLPLVIYGLFEKNYLKKWYKYLIFILIIIPPFYLIGTKTPLFAVMAIILFYTIMKIINAIMQKKVDRDMIFFVILSVILLGTFTHTFGYDNFKNQLAASEGDSIGADLISANLFDENKYEEYEKKANDKKYISVFENRMMLTLYRYRDIKSSVFDNRSIQKVLNKYLWSISPLKDKLFGYGHDVMPNCTWVETDIFTIFYCYGIIGFIIILMPIVYISINGLKCLFNIKKMDRVKFLFGFVYGISLFVLYSVGYTMQFAQTVFYLAILFVISDIVFKEKEDSGSQKDYLFMLNDLSIGGAEVGMVDVVNELVKMGKKVDVVLLRKRGPLLDKLAKEVNVYEILNQDYSKIKRKIYHVFYILGGMFTRYIYGKTIKDKYKTEVAYIEGYPAVFIASSNNYESAKIASIRVGLKNHKLKASKIPWGEYLVRQAYKKMDYIYTVSDLTTKEFLEKYPFCESKTRTIYTYFNTEDIRKKAKEKYDFVFDKSKVNFLAVGRFNAQKSYDRLIEAFYEITKKYDNVMLHFLGNYNTPEGKMILDKIKDKHLEDSVVIHGVIANPYPYIKDCDVLISSSLYEGFPRVINEAISLGKLCIGTNVTGTSEALHQGKYGLLVENSVQGLVKGMTTYLENPNIYEQYQKEMKKFDGNKKTYFCGLEEISHRRKSMIIYMPKLSFGGMEKSLVNLINYASLDKKYDLTVCLTYTGEMNYLNLLPSDIKLIVLWKGKWNASGKVVGGLGLLTRYVYQIFKKYDLAVSYAYQHPILTTLTRLSSKNNIVYIHTNLVNSTPPNLLKKRIKKCKYEKFTKIICVSFDAKKTLLDLIGKRDNVYVVNNIIDGDKILEKANEEVNDFDFKDNKIYFINISRHYEKHKKILRLIESVKKLNSDGYDFEVLLIGDGEDHKLYVDKINEYHLHNIHLLGKKSNPYKYLKKSSALVLSSVSEGYPVVFVEAMILNTPIITTNVSDAKKDIQGKYGIVTDNDDEAIYNGMKQFLDSGYKVKNVFDYEKFNSEIIKQIDEIYNKE